MDQPRPAARRRTQSRRQQQPAAPAREPAPPVETVDVNVARANLTVELREELRPSMRPNMRDDVDHLARAEARTRDLLGDEDEMLDVNTEDKFHIDKDQIPDGWSYNWKRLSVINQENHQYLNEQRRMGWEPVATKRHPEMMPPGTDGDSAIIRDGLILMERPKQISDMMEERARRVANKQIKDKEAQLRAAPPGTFARNTVEVNKGFERIPIPKD